MIKSNGKFLFVASGDILIASDIKSGKIVANITLPAIEYPASNIDYNLTDNDIMENNNASSIMLNQSFFSDGEIIYGDTVYLPKAQIQSLLLTENRLTVIISGYVAPSLQATTNVNIKPIMFNYLATRIQIYDTSALATSGGKLTLLNETEVNGDFRYGCVIGGNVHIVTVVDFNLVSSLLDPLSKWLPMFVGLSINDYANAAIKLAKEKLIPQFVDQLVQELFVTGKIDLAQISLLQSQLPNSRDQFRFKGSIIDFLTQVVSIDLSETTSDDLTLSLSGAFLLPSRNLIFATEDMIIVTAEGSNWNLSLGGLSLTACLLGFKFDGASSTPHAVGTIDGTLNPHYFVDIHDGYIYLPTTLETKMSLMRVTL